MPVNLAMVIVTEGGGPMKGGRMTRDDNEVAVLLYAFLCLLTFVPCTYIILKVICV